MYDLQSFLPEQNNRKMPIFLTNIGSATIIQRIVRMRLRSDFIYELGSQTFHKIVTNRTELSRYYIDSESAAKR